MLTARDAVEDRVSGLDRGADDYLTKPFEFRERCWRGFQNAFAGAHRNLHPPRLWRGDQVLDTAAQSATYAEDTRYH